LKVLLVEDDDLAAEKYGRALRFGRFEVVTVSNADAALREIAADPADVVLIDLRLRPVALVELVRQVRAREHGRHTPVAILTGDYYGFQMTLEEELKSLNASLFYKPLLPQHLVLITRALAGGEM
jgi:DNA-binding response OmpR family regulator